MADEVNKIKKDGIISWRAAEFRYVQKGPLWYFVVSLVILFLVIFALVQKNFFFAFFIVVAGAIVFYLSNRRPRVFDFEVNEEGIKIGKATFYRYDEIEGFSIYERPQQLNDLVIKRKVTINPYLRIPIDDKHSKQVEDFLNDKLKQISYQPSFIDLLADWLGF